MMTATTTFNSSFTFFSMHYLIFKLIILLLITTSVDCYDVVVLPVLQAIGNRHMFTVHARTTLAALLDLLAAHY